jgi:hypothetical protein
MLLSAVSLLGCTGYTTPPRGAVAVQTENARAAIFFSDNDRAEIRRYYRKHLPPGLAKRESLPPGLRKQLVKRGTLPPGLRSAQLPAELNRRLSHLPDGYIRLRVATDVILLNEHTRVILDVVSDISN